MDNELNAQDLFLQALRFDFSGMVLVMHAHNTWRQGAGIERKSTPDGGVHTLLPSGVRPPTIIAAMVCEAFCVELYIKTIYSLEKLQYPKAHSLDKLFHGLPRKWQERIREQFKTELQRTIFDEMRKSSECPKDVDTCLAQAAEAFQNWRYSFEFSPPSQFLAPARHSLLKAIVKDHPDWDSLRQGLDTPSVG